MIGHLGSRVSALLDGQLPPAEAERAWSHVHGCHACRDLVEREGWVKTRLSSLSGDGGGAPDQLKGSLLGSSVLAAPAFPTYDSRPRRHVGMVALGGSAVGAAVVGALVLAALPGQAPDRPPTTSFERRTEPPVARLGSATPTPGPQLTSSPRR